MGVEDATWLLMLVHSKQQKLGWGAHRMHGATDTGIATTRRQGVGGEGVVGRPHEGGEPSCPAWMASEHHRVGHLIPVHPKLRKLG